MAQADSVPSSSRQLITGETASQSTNLRAVKQRAVRAQPVDHRPIVGDSYAPVIMGTDEAAFWLWRRKRKRSDGAGGLVEVPPLWGRRSDGSNVGALSYETAAFCWGDCFETFF